MALDDLLHGKAVGEIPKDACTSIIAAVTGYSIEYIESLPEKKFRRFFPLFTEIFRWQNRRLM